MSAEGPSSCCIPVTLTFRVSVLVACCGPSCLLSRLMLCVSFRNAMTVCFSEALRQGFTLYIRPHLDDGTASGAWRNGLLLQPTTKYNGYRSVMGTGWHVTAYYLL